METNITYKQEDNSLDYLKKKGKFYKLIIDENTPNQQMFRFDDRNIDEFKQRIVYYDKQNNLKEEFYLKGINNLIKKNNLLQLSLQLADNLITEEEFEDEINNNSEKYIISVQHVTSVNQLYILKDIVKKIGKEFSVDEITEMFSLSFNNLDKVLNQ